MANTGGAFVGARAGLAISRHRSLLGLRRLRAEGLADVAELRPFAIASLVLLIAFWQPFDVTLEVGTVVGKVRSLQADLWQFTGLRDEGTSLMLSTFFAMTLASYLSVLGERHAGGTGSDPRHRSSCPCWRRRRFFIGSRMPGLWDALVAAVGHRDRRGVWAVAARIIWPASLARRHGGA